MKKRQIFIIALSLLLIVFLIEYMVSDEQRFIYTKPAFQGRMIDNETKEPIEGVVVVVIYSESYSFCLNPGGCSPSIAGVTETLTDKKGEFHIRPFITWMGPFGEIEDAEFIIYKPGYACYPESMNDHELMPLNTKTVYIEDLFSKEIGTKGTVTYPPGHGYAKDGKTTTVETIFGIVEMPKLKKREDRLRALPSFPSGYDENDLPLFYVQIKKDRKFLFNEQ